MNEPKQPGGVLPAGEIAAPILPEETPEAAAFAPLDDIAAPADVISAPQEEAPVQTRSCPVPPPPPPKPRFSATLTEILGALACYVLAWIWFDFGNAALNHKNLIWLPVFVLGFLALTEWLHRGTKRPRESWVWLGCVAVLTAALALNRCRAWSIVYDDGYVYDNGHNAVWDFLHIFAIWWVLSRGGRLAEGESGHLLPYDALNAFIVFPFKHFFLRIRCLWYGLTRIGRGEKRLGTVRLLWSLGAGFAALLLLLRAATLLTEADSGFDSFLTKLGEWLSPDESDRLRFIFSLPVGAYIFGLVAGSAREDPQRLRDRGAGLTSWLSTLRKVPNGVFAVVLAVFAVFYLSFFALQGSYLFGAFTRTLPEGFIVSQYARQGFFELCRVMALNFALLWICARFAGSSLRENRLLRVLAAVLLAESLLFAVVAASKLGLYIDCFGFTPKRLQAAWLVTVLSVGCGCALWTLFSGKKTFRAWLIFGAVSLSLLCLY